MSAVDCTCGEPDRQAVHRKTLPCFIHEDALKALFHEHDETCAMGLLANREWRTGT